jgi:hypothetical protein
MIESDRPLHGYAIRLFSSDWMRLFDHLNPWRNSNWLNYYLNS